MTHIKKAIEDAIGGGWKREINGKFDGFSDGKIYFLKTSPTNETITLESALLDPLFWQALGKTRGWGRIMKSKKFPEGIWDEDKYNKYWRENWHSLINHLAQQRPIDEFFENLK